MQHLGTSDPVATAAYQGSDVCHVRLQIAFVWICSSLKVGCL